MDVEAIGAATTAGLASSAPEKPTGHAGEAHHICTDCGAEVSGRFCSNCGQPAHVHRTLLHLGEELLHGVMHFDSRTWRTLPLLVFRPGTLTHEWVHGKRTRYVSPLAMFLFTVFVMFLALSYLPGGPKTVAGQQITTAAELANERTELAEAEAKLRAALPEERTEAAGEVKSELKDVHEAAADFAEVTTLTAPSDWKSELAAQTASGKFKINTGSKKLDEKIREKLENPELALYKLQQTVYKFSFLLVPISIPFVALLFLWKRGFTLYDHGVFVLYSLTFMSVLAMAAAGILRLGSWTGTWVATLVTLAIPLHMFFQLKGAYGLGVFSALWRTGFLLMFCAITITLFMLAILWLGVG
ncbi:MAG: DUF3667 domain-containing protein [Phenylobacterium sp.]